MIPTSWCTPIDSYCERTDAGFWSEPINALSNLAFLAAAYAAWRLWRRSGGGDRPVVALIGVTAIVGIGSFLFHTFANRWSLVADVLPIMVFIYGYFLLAMRRFLALGPWSALLATGAFAVFNAGFAGLWSRFLGEDAGTANGSIGYFPAALALIAIGAILVLLPLRSRAALAREALPQVHRRETILRVLAPDLAGRALILAAAIFALSLVFRSIDILVCGWLAIGTHFLWHTLNALVLFVLLRGAIGHRALTLSAR